MPSSCVVESDYRDYRDCDYQCYYYYETCYMELLSVDHDVGHLDAVTAIDDLFD